MKRALLISRELLVELCKGLMPGGDLRFYKVESNPIPSDARVVGQQLRADGTIAIVLESAEFTDTSDLPPVLLASVRPPEVTP